MANKKVSLLRYCRVDKDGVSVWKRYPAAIGRNGRIRPEFVVIDGQQVHCPAGHYELRYYEGRKLRYENAGDNAAELSSVSVFVTWMRNWQKKRGWPQRLLLKRQERKS